MYDAELKSLLTERARSDAFRPDRAGPEPAGRAERRATSPASPGLAKSTVSTTLDRAAEIRHRGRRRRRQIRRAGERRPAGNDGDAQPARGHLRRRRCSASQHIQLIVADVSHAVIGDKTVLHRSRLFARTQPPRSSSALIAGGLRRASASRSDTLLGVGMALAGAGQSARRPHAARRRRPDLGRRRHPRRCSSRRCERPVFADNESNCSAIAEMMWGAAVGHEDFVFVHPRPRRRRRDRPPRPCHHRHRRRRRANSATCRSTRTARSAAAATAAASSSMPVSGSRWSSREQRFGRPMTTEDVIGLAFAGDVGCKRLLLDCAEAAGRGLGIVGSVLNPRLLRDRRCPGDAPAICCSPRSRPSYNKHTLVKRTDVGNASQTKFVTSKFADNGACLGAVGVVLQHHARLA